MFATLALHLVLTQTDHDSFALGARLKDEFAPGQWGNIVFESRGTAQGDWYRYTMDSFTTEYNGRRWRILISSSGFASFSASQAGFEANTAIHISTPDFSAKAREVETKFQRVVRDAGITWSSEFGQATDPTVDTVVFKPMFRDLPVLSKRLYGWVSWKRVTGEVVSFLAQLRRPTCIINEGDPISPQIAALRMQPHLRNPERTLDPKKLVLGWSVETNEGRTRLIYFYEAPPPGGLDRLAVDAVTGQLVEPPPYR